MRSISISIGWLSIPPATITSLVFTYLLLRYFNIIGGGLVGLLSIPFHLLNGLSMIPICFVYGTFE